MRNAPRGATAAAQSAAIDALTARLDAEILRNTEIVARTTVRENVLVQMQTAVNAEELKFQEDLSLAQTELRSAQEALEQAQAALSQRRNDAVKLQDQASCSDRGAAELRLWRGAEFVLRVREPDLHGLVAELRPTFRQKVKESRHPLVTRSQCRSSGGSGAHDAVMPWLSSMSELQTGVSLIPHVDNLLQRCPTMSATDVDRLAARIHEVWCECATSLATRTNGVV